MLKVSYEKHQCLLPDELDVRFIAVNNSTYVHKNDVIRIIRDAILTSMESLMSEDEAKIAEKNKRLESLILAVKALKANESGLQHDLDDYLNAPSGVGPLASEWIDKPHRLIYDLTKEIARLEGT